MITDCQISIDKLRAAVGETTTPSAGPRDSETSHSMSKFTARKIYQDNLEALRHAAQGEGNALLNKTAFFAGCAFAAGALDQTAEAIQQQQFDIVTKEWQQPHDEHGAKMTIESGWRSGIAHPLKLKPDSEIESSLIIRSMDDVQEKPIEWLWPNRIPLSAVSIFTGNPDTGKTMAYCDVAARVSTTRDFPDAKFPSGVGGEVLMLCAEDDYARVIKPRLVAAGADIKSIYFVDKVEIRQGAKRDERMFALDTDLSKIETELEGNPLCALIIIDPISSYFGKGNMNNKQDVRTIFNRLTTICEKYRVSVIGVEHFNKRTDVGAIHKLGGSVALVAATRAAHMFAKVPEQEGQYVMHFVKGNFAKKKTGLRFTIGDKESATLGADPETGQPYRVPYIVWGAEDADSADDVLRGEKTSTVEKRGDRAARFLRNFLTEEKLSSDIEAEAKKHGISRSALFEAKKNLKDQGYKITATQREGGWWWSPPKGDEPRASGTEKPVEDEIPF